jgi:hypothetical protein
MSRAGTASGIEEWATSSALAASGVALMLAGASFVAFMALHPFGELAGQRAALRVTWLPAHTFHFLGALLALFGLPGLYTRQMRRAGKLGLAGFVGAFAGTAMFVGTGMITAFVWPVIARYDPGFVAANGPLFRDTLTRLAIDGTYAVLAVGWVIFAVAMLRARVLPRPGALAVLIGVLLFSAPVAPVGPAPWIVRVIGAFVFGGGLAWLGWALWSEGHHRAVVAQQAGWPVSGRAQ